MIDKKTLNGIMAVLSVLVLLIPIGVSGYVQEKTIDNIVNVQGSYGIGTTMGLYDGTRNLTEIADDNFISSSIDQVIGWDANNDTIFQGYTNTGTYTLRDGTYYGNYNTYTGNGNHTMAVDWTNVPYSTYNSNRILYIPTNFTNSDLSEMDFVRFHSTIDQTETINFFVMYENQYGSLDEILMNELDSDTWFGIVDYSAKQGLNANPNGSVIIGFSAVSDNFNESQSSFTWMVETNSLDESDYVFGSEFSDFTIWMGLIVGMDAFFLFVLMFANPKIDIKWDNRKGKWRK